ncbi:ribonuclease P protein subunit p30 isoform X2 [Glossina fuscipes]|uniref:Ribonuclease P protein subunit p30 isoform X2 n=1 Tax=Glossina fuscipes TaxID=7396 RepID=A0A9C5ZA00_9MUSC|nr:ribonuclease P protein subunit p30 isoform X2 [Glossina fuscipes]
MEETKEFYDFCIPFNEDKVLLKEVCEKLFVLGYKTIAIELFFDHSKKENSKRLADVFPKPHDLMWLETHFRNKLKILQRITICYADALVTHAMTNSINLRKFHIIAGQPKTEAALAHCCTAFNGDLLTFDAQHGNHIHVSRKGYQLAVKRGLFFEIKYSPCKSKNIIISSGANNVFELRGPQDVTNLGFIFSLSEDQAKCAINRFGRQLFLRAECRRLGKTIMFIKASGPVLFSDSCEEKSELGNNAEITLGGNIREDSDPKDQPSKKKRLF